MLQKSIKIANAVFWCAIAVVVALLVVRGFNPEFLRDYRAWNALPAEIATYLLLATVLPGVLLRLSVTSIVVRWLIAWRRTIGIAMYFFGLLHLLFLLDDLPWFSGGAITSLDILTATGLFAMLVLLPVLVTSNAASIRFFKKRWKTLQRLTYIALPLVGYHLYEIGETVAAYAYGYVAVLIVASFLIHGFKKGAFAPMARQSATVVFAAAAITMGTLWIYDDGFFARKKTNTNDATGAREQDVISVTDVVEPVKESIKEPAKEPAGEGIEEVALTLDQEVRFDEEEESQESGSFEDGVYEANGVFVTARGRYTESVDITVTVEGDVVTDLEVVGNINNQKSQQYQNRFEGSIFTQVIGREIGSIELDAVAGASDTTDGFMVALEQIRQDARR